jgi:hypothetical protein
LIELDHEPVAAQLSTRSDWRVYFHQRYADQEDVNGEYIRHKVSSHTGRVTEAIPRATARSELQTALTPSDSADRGSFTVRALETLL